MATITNEQLETLVTMLQYNEEIIFDFMDEEAQAVLKTQLAQYIQSAASFIEREGITLDFTKIDDSMLTVMYASWLYDKRKDGVSIMPRMLRYNLNNRLFAQKVAQNEE